MASSADVVRATKLGGDILDALGLSGKNVKRVSIECEAGSLAVVNLALYPNGREADEIKEIIHRYNIVEDSRLKQAVRYDEGEAND